MKPSLCRSVVIKGVQSNGSDEQSAIVTRVWGNGEPALNEPVCINVMVLPDCGVPFSATSVSMFENRRAAMKYLEVNPSNRVCFWPDRV